ncbi:fibronectin type III domain-containing protein [Paenarthrobacter sp. PH39-S1]|uniref:fibronectin type III domain-containing protein n=1 Tax=Paenarthrobacter sp. PH39-S1 TaxID=3046204 RepID=UPI0024BAC51A|nr:fibronectin type III domain-containing protein [Paenarthrobacter sp. PH39-S1]MDJ0355223.1 fibronectin type III domain-containing protein [Paenarthrobacter sp. PH39-S1]
MVVLAVLSLVLGITGPSAGAATATAPAANVPVTTVSTPPPTGLKATGQVYNGIDVSWDAVAGAGGYRLYYSTNADMSNAVFKRSTGPSVSIGGLAAQAVYYVKVRALTADGANLTGYADAVSAKTGPIQPLPPTGLASSAQYPTSLTMAWNAVTGAAGYRLMYSSHADMSTPSYRNITGSLTGSFGGLTPETTYYVQIRATNANGDGITDYSPAVSAKTAVAPPAPPVGLKVTKQSPTTLSFTWGAVPNAPEYRLSFSKSADMSSAAYTRYTVTSAEVRGLSAASTYYVQVRAINLDGSTITSYSPVLKVTTGLAPVLAAVNNPLTVASYNIMCANCIGDNELNPDVNPWVVRRDAVVATITSKMPDIMGIQEASQGWLADSPPGGLSQFEDLKQRLNAAGAPYELTNDKRNNCVDPQTPTDCVYMDQGASQGDRIFYNPNKVKIVRSGSQQLPFLDPAKNERYVAWAEVIQLSSGKHFFYGTTHLEVTKADGYNELRAQQAQAIMDVIHEQNAANLPVIMVGDMNSSKWLEPTNSAYDVFVGAGLIDPLGNTYKSFYPSGDATAETVINANINSWNGYQRLAGAFPTGQLGTYIDYIFTSKMRVQRYENVANIDTNGNYIGVFPSDHNMQYATVGLP